jgi:ATP-dependent helicase/nuclease subunit A
LDPLLARASEMMRSAPGLDTPDGLMSLATRLRYHETVADWSDDATFCCLMETVRPSHLDITQKRWASDKAGKAAAKALAEEFVACMDEVVVPLVAAWHEYRYPLVIRVLHRAVRDYAQQRVARGTPTFDDLLHLAAQLLREHPSVRNELGERYRYLLIDEFQDTDPMQAEVCLLLSSDASQGSDWTHVVPRDGALFVVGDPKQSIYRFRRADIQIYERVKSRFGEFGAVLALTTNFRSVPEIAAFVNTHFTDKFPALASGEQAAFSPLVPASQPGRGSLHGLMRYVVQPDARNKDAVLETDAMLLASWIETCIEHGEPPGSFLILTERKNVLTLYARALAAHGIPSSTTGASLSFEYELQELLVILRALADPQNAISVVSALESVFFGFSPADLFTARSLGIAFSITAPQNGDVHPVAAALSVLRHWWMYSRAHAADMLLEKICDDSGVLLYAAGAELGDVRAGALLHCIAAVREAATGGRGGLRDAVQVIDALLDAEIDDVTLQPGRTDAVRIMNLHKSKGLEAEIVVLAAPVDTKIFAIDTHVTRDAAGVARGGIQVAIGPSNNRCVLAQPVGWREMAETEARFGAAEKDRVRYVAATRARRALVVAQAVTAAKVPKPDASIWRPFAAVLDAMAPEPMKIAVRTPPSRSLMPDDAASMRSKAAFVAQRRMDAGIASDVVRTVTQLTHVAEVGAKAADGDAVVNDGDALRLRGGVASSVRGGTGRGAAWGRAVHRALDGLARGRRGDVLVAYTNAVAKSELLSAADASSLLALVFEIAQSDRWRALADGVRVSPELTVAIAEVSSSQTVLTEGVVDLAILRETGWQVVDWKSDDVDDATWALRRVMYERQAAQYAAMLSTITQQSSTSTVERVQVRDTHA